MNQFELRQNVLLSLQRALLSYVPCSLRGVTCKWDDRTIVIKCYFDGKITDEDHESMECVATEVMSDFAEHDVSIECIRCDAPMSLNDFSLMAWVYRRKE